MSLYRKDRKNRDRFDIDCEPNITSKYFLVVKFLNPKLKKTNNSVSTILVQIQKDGSIKKINKLQTQDISQINVIYFYENIDYKSLFKQK